MISKDTLREVGKIEDTVKNWERRLDIIKTNITGQQVVRDELRRDIEEAKKQLDETKKECSVERDVILKLKNEALAEVKARQDALHTESASLGNEKVIVDQGKEQVGHVREESLALKNKLNLVSKKIDEAKEILNK